MNSTSTCCSSPKKVNVWPLSPRSLKRSRLKIYGISPHSPSNSVNFRPNPSSFRGDMRKCVPVSRLLLMTSRKSHTRFRSVPTSTTLDDLEGPLRRSVKTRASFGAYHENLNDYGPILSATKMYPMTNEPMTLLSGKYADACGGSRDLCKFSLDLRMPAPIYAGVV